MPKRLTIEDIQNYIDEHDIDNDCILLSTEYKNINTPLELFCNRCGSTFQKDFQHLKRGVFCCQSCSKKKAAALRALGIDEIKKFIQENDINNDCTLISEMYINSTTPLDFICNKCGKKFQRDWQHIKRYRFQCPECGMHQGATHKKYTKEEVQKDIAKDGYTMIGEYIDASTPFDVICKRGHKTKLLYVQYKHRGSGCKECSIIEHSGENHWNWKGGSTEVRDYLRKSTKQWKRDVLIRDGFKCILSGVQNNSLVVHHLQSYNTLLEKASQNTGIPILSHFSDYENEEYLILKEELIKLHDVNNGVTLTQPIHDLFHQLYGKGNNTKAQFEEFSKRYSNGEFKKTN